MYAQLADLKARAGVLAKAWPNPDVDDASLDTFLEQTAGELDAALGAAGFAVPVTDPVAVEALVSPNADMALLLAIDATWPGGSGDVAALRQEVLERVQAYAQAVQDKDLPALLYLGAQQAAEAYGGASNFWSEDGSTYEWWSRWAYRYAGWTGSVHAIDPWGVPVSAGPAFTKGMRL